MRSRVLFLLPKLPLYSCWVVLHSCCVVLYSCCLVLYSCCVVLYSCCVVLSRVVTRVVFQTRSTRWQTEEFPAVHEANGYTLKLPAPSRQNRHKKYCLLRCVKVMEKFHPARSGWNENVKITSLDKLFQRKSQISFAS